MNEVSEYYQQKTLCQARMALCKGFNKKIDFIPALLTTELSPRDYSEDEVFQIVKNLNSKNVISILICYYSGLRAHELATINRKNELERSNTRKWTNELFFAETESTIFVVVGKGGLQRWVIIPDVLAEELEKFRLSVPTKVTDRDIFYYTNYSVGFGQALSECFSRASNEVLGFSNGLHGLRHSYAKRRLKKLLRNNMSIDDAKLIVSQELGHFRPEITNCYFR